jgi:hypothetical protein
MHEEERKKSARGEGRRNGGDDIYYVNKYIAYIYSFTP